MAKIAKVLVLGGTGIIGQHLCKVLFADGHQVYVTSRSARSDTDGIRYIHVNARDKDSLRRAIDSMQLDAVVDLVSFSKDQVLDMVSVFKGKIKQYMFVSSATVHDGGSNRERIDEKTKFVHDGWSYPLEKIKAEKALHEACSDASMNYTIIRPYITYSSQRISFGGWEGASILKAIIEGRPIVLAEELASSVTTLTHSHDLAVGISGLVLNDKAMNEDFIIASNEPHEWREVLEVTASITGSRLELVDVPGSEIKKNFPELTGKINDRHMSRSFNIAKLKKAVVNYEVKYSLAEGYKEIIPMILSSTTATSQGLVFQGRHDRLAFQFASSAGRKAIRKYQRRLIRENLTSFVKYYVGYCRPLYLVAKECRDLAKRLRGRRSDYGI